MTAPNPSPETVAREAQHPWSGLRVEKHTGEARWFGTVVSVYQTLRGGIRFVVEVEPQGFQMIAVENQLRLALAADPVGPEVSEAMVEAALDAFCKADKPIVLDNRPVMSFQSSLRRMRAALTAAFAARQPAPAAVGEWRPIETAPKDGTPVLVAAPGKYGWYIDVAENWSDNINDVGQGSPDEWTARESDTVVSKWVSYWQPLPAPPASPPTVPGEG